MRMTENGSHLKSRTLSVKPHLDVDLGNDLRFPIVGSLELIDSNSYSEADESPCISILQLNTKGNGSHL